MILSQQRHSQPGGSVFQIIIFILQYLPQFYPQLYYNSMNTIRLYSSYPGSDHLVRWYYILFMMSLPPQDKSSAYLQFLYTRAPYAVHPVAQTPLRIHQR